MRLTAKQIVWLKVLLHLAGLLPFIWLFWAVNAGAFSADPAKDIQHFTGRMALKFLLATLLVSPLARYAKQPLLIRTRRLLGLWCFAWATIHLTSYALLELGINNAGADAHLHAVCPAKTGPTVAVFAQRSLSGCDPRPHSLPVVGENSLAAAYPLCAPGAGPAGVAL